MFLKFCFSTQVQFDEHESEKTFTIQINDDSVYEGVEDFYVQLSVPTYALLGKTSKIFTITSF